MGLAVTIIWWALTSTPLLPGVTHEGTAEGKWEKIGGVNSYVATPTMDYPKDKVLLFLSDIFGPQLINAQLLADDYARNGFKTVIPDYLNGDPIPVEAMEAGKFDIGKWFVNHGPEQTRPPLDKVIAALKTQGVTTFAAAGYCLGGRYAFDLAFDGVITAAVVCHPSLLQVPEDLEKWAKTKVPLLINSCTTDPQFPAESQTKADEILGGGKFAPGYKREFWEGAHTGSRSAGI
ncbi:Alpha/Beta hydrolase protein [Infundibulicybe gibba]|nr:Alpha/Beta hydrolase protein [Infundibulicybe gibba]